MKDILANLYRLQTLDIAGTKTEKARTAALRSGIPEGMLTNYDRARARGRKGISVVRDNVCTNCRIQVPVAVTASLMGGDVQVCGNCGLYLCLPEPVEAPAPLVVVAKVPAVRRRKKTPASVTLPAI